jgi:exodeoxyribonuclease-3
VIVASWNVNSIKARLPNVLEWLKQRAPDIACLQEIKCIDANFPAQAFEELGYNVAVHGQKTYNGVAILSKRPFDEIVPRLPGDESDEQARYLEAVVSTDTGILRVACLYLPNGNPVESEEKYGYKLNWMERLQTRTRELLALEEAFVLAGDFNVIPAVEDVYDPQGWAEDALFRLQTREKFHALVNLGLTDSLRACTDQAHQYSFWDYQRGAWAKDHGLRIDHLLLSPQAADQLKQCEIDKFTRGWTRPSDHAPIWVELD